MQDENANKVPYVAAKKEMGFTWCKYDFGRQNLSQLYDSFKQFPYICTGVNSVTSIEPAHEIMVLIT